MSVENDVVALQGRIASLERRQRVVVGIGLATSMLCAWVLTARVTVAQDPGSTRSTDDLAASRHRLQGLIAAQGGAKDVKFRATQDDNFLAQNFLIVTSGEGFGGLGNINGVLQLALYDEPDFAGVTARAESGASAIELTNRSADRRIRLDAAESGAVSLAFKDNQSRDRVLIGVDAGGAAYLRMYDRFGRRRFNKRFP